MATLQKQALGMIATCKTALATVAKKAETNFVDNATVEVARAILEQAKAELPNDKVLAAVSLDAPVYWTTVLAAMQTVTSSIPDETEAGLIERLRAGRQRVEQRTDK